MSEKVGNEAENFQNDEKKQAAVAKSMTKNEKGKAKAPFHMSPHVKRIIFLGLIVLAVIFLVFQFQKGSDFRAAKREFNNGNYQEASEMFSKLGTYSDSDHFVLYCYALQAFDEGKYQDAIVQFTSLEGFQKSARYAAYCHAVIAYESGNYWEAAEYYEKSQETLLGTTTFLDSAVRIKRCYYNCGTLLYLAGDYVNAVICFEKSLGYEDSEQLLAECQKHLN